MFAEECWEGTTQGEICRISNLAKYHNIGRNQIKTLLTKKWKSQQTLPIQNYLNCTKLPSFKKKV